MSTVLPDPHSDLSLAELRRVLQTHPLYAAVHDLSSLQIFMREHAFAVWDFMSLLKRMQQLVTCTQLPWQPAADPAAARFILEIVLGEEADEDGQGGYASHFELYHAAMRELGASTLPIDGLLTRLTAGENWESALNTVPVLESTRDFVRFSLKIAFHGAPHDVAAAFFYGREDVIPDMFARLIEPLQEHGAKVGRLRHYLQRHIDLDGDSHGPLAQKLLERLCQGDPVRIAEADQVACEALRKRIALWDGIWQALST